MTAQPNRPHYPALDGLRGTAILLVVIYHNFGFIKQSYFGWLGVDLFFVLSGFLITDILLRALDSPGFLKNFYLRRVFRIFPLYYLSLLLFLFIVAPLTDDRIVWSYYQENQFYFWTYLQNWLFIFKDPGNAHILNHYWSLAVEEQFYIFWPLAILILKKPKRLMVLICGLLLAVILFRFGLWIYKVENLAYYNLYTFTRIDGICIGCIVALLTRMNASFIRNNMALIVLGFAAINFIFFFVNQQFNYSFPYIALVGYTTFAMMFGLLVYEAVTRETRVINYIFGSKILKFFGKISYGLYIFHWPIYILFTVYLPDLFGDTVPEITAKVLLSITATVVAIGISLISYYSFERYFLKMKEKYAG